MFSVSTVTLKSVLYSKRLLVSYPSDFILHQKGSKFLFLFMVDQKPNRAILKHFTCVTNNKICFLKVFLQ